MTEGATPPAAEGEDRDELIDEAGEESFPASDPPASWSGPDEDAEPPERPQQ